MRSRNITYNPTGPFPPTLNAQKFHPTYNVPTTVNGFYNPRYRLKDEALTQTVLSPNQRRRNGNGTQITLGVRETGETTTLRRFQSQQTLAEEFLRKDSSTNNNFDPERSLEHVNKFRASTANSSSSKSIREKRYSLDGVHHDASMTPLMKESFSLDNNYVEPVETKDASTETVSGVMKKKFESMNDIGNWEREIVEPFLFKLKKAIMHTKPEFLEEFVIGYCSREAMDQPHPDLPKTMQYKKKQRSILKPESKERGVGVGSGDDKDIGTK